MSRPEVLDYIPDDGYTEKAFVAGRPGLHNDFRFEFRPADAPEQADMLDTLDKLSIGQQRRVKMEFLSRKIRWWSLKGRTGEAIPVDVKIKLKPALFQRISDIVYGLESGDEDPQWSDTEKQTVAVLATQAAVAALSVPAARAAADRGN